MRNWNFIYPNVLLTTSTSFYSTYEELKPSIVDTLCLIFSSFYSTYEELKPTELAIYTSHSLCFYSTYEELKLVY